MNKTTNKSAILYARFSPRPNAPDCDSVERQIWDMRRWAKRNKYTIVAEYSDKALSGSDADRPGLWDAIYSLKRGYVLMVRTWDRLARDSYLGEVIQQQCKKKGCRVLAIQQTESSKDGPESKLIRTILLALAEYQRQIIRARTRAAMRRHQSEGRRMSHRLPYGWRPDPKDDARMLPNPYEQEVIKRVMLLHKHDFGHRAIARQLAIEGYEPRKIEKRWKNGRIGYKAGKWTHKLVGAILRRAEST